VSNVAVAVKEILTGTFDWPMIAVVFVVDVAAAAWATRLTARALSTERLTSAAHVDTAELLGGPALFPRQVFYWFAGVWTAMVVASANMGAADVRVQLLVNLPFLFGGATALVLRRYRLDARETLSLRRVKPAVWLAVILGAPGGLLTGTALFKLASYVMPVPPDVLKAFGRAIFPDNLSTWQLVLFLCVLPGVFEELLFRGVLLSGLVRRYRPVTAALVVGLMFGVTHFALFRIVPTAYLGVLLAAVVLLTGSIFPAMLWHALNNGIALLLTKAELTLPGLDWRLGLCGVAALGTCFWILWRERGTPG